MPRPSVIPVEQAARVRAAADVSEKTLRRYLAGVSVLGSTLRRITAALEAEGRADLVERRRALVHGQDAKSDAA